MHLEDEQIQRLLHGELDRAAEGAARAHLGACADCRGQLADAEREEERIFGLLRRVDHAAPAVDLQTLAARARGEAARRVRWAAGVALALAAAGAAYAAPGSPVPGWVDRLGEWIAGPAPRGGPTVETPATEPGAAGIAVEPSERFTIVFGTEQTRGIAAVSLIDGSNIVARRLNGSATFTTDIDYLTIEDGGSTADYEIELPRNAPWVQIRAGGRRLLLKDGPRVITDAPVDARGRYLLPLSPPGR